MASFLQNVHPIDSHYLDYATQYAQLQALADLRRQRREESAAKAQETELNQLKLEQARQAMTEQAIIREKFPGMMADPQYQTEGKPDMMRILNALAQQPGIGLGTIQGLQKTILDNVKQRAEVQKLIAESTKASQEAENQRQTALGSARDHYAGVIQDYFDHGSNRATLEGIMQREINDPAAALYKQQMQSDYDQFNGLPEDAQTAFLQRIAGSMSPAAQEARGKAAKEKLDLATAMRKSVGSQLGATPDQMAYLKALDELRKSGTVPPDILNEFANGSPEIAQRMSMTGAEQVKADKEDPAKNVTDAQLRWMAETDPDPDKRSAADRALKRRVSEQQAIHVTVNPAPAGVTGALNKAGDLAGEEFLATLPKAFAAQVRQIGQGDVTIPSASTKNATAQALRTAVFQYDPEFNEQRAQLRKDFIKNKNIGNLNTAVVHLDQFGEAAKAMGNGTFRPGNALFNSIVETFGGSAPTNFAGLKTAVAGEMANALKGTATDPEIAHISEVIQSKNSPQQLADYVQSQLHVLGAKMNTYLEQWHQVSRGDSVWSPVLPSARAVFAKYGQNPTAGPGASHAAAGGPAAAAKVYLNVKGKGRFPFPDQATADAFKKKYPQLVE